MQQTFKKKKNSLRELTLTKASICGDYCLLWTLMVGGLYNVTHVTGNTLRSWKSCQTNVFCHIFWIPPPPAKTFSNKPHSSPAISVHFKHKAERWEWGTSLLEKKNNLMLKTCKKFYFYTMTKPRRATRRLPVVWDVVQTLTHKHCYVSLQELLKICKSKHKTLIMNTWIRTPPTAAGWRVTVGHDRLKTYPQIHTIRCILTFCARGFKETLPHSFEKLCVCVRARVRVCFI